MSLIRGSYLRLLGRGDADEAAAAAFVFEFHVPGDQRKERVILAPSDVYAWLMLGAALPHQDCAGIDELSAETLYSEPLTV